MHIVLFIAFSVFYLDSRACKSLEGKKKKAPKSTPTEAPLSHRKPCSLNFLHIFIISASQLVVVVVVVSGAGSGVCELTNQSRPGIQEGGS